VSDNLFWDRIAERATETINALKTGRRPEIIRYAAHVTSNCNMYCRYCNTVKSPQVMNRGLFIAICQRASKKGIVHITGGEPMCVPWLEDEIYNQRNVTRLALNTNLLKLPKHKTLESIFRVKTSLDDYDAERWNELTGGCYFEKVVSHIRITTEVVPYVSVCFTATHQSIERLPKFIEFCHDAFPKLATISVSFYKGSRENLKLKQSDVDELFEISDHMDNKSKSLFRETHHRQGNYYPENLDVPCYLSFTERLYDEWGREFYCSHLFRDHVEPPGMPGQDPHCVTGCNARFYKYNQMIHREIAAKRCCQEVMELT